MWQNLLRHCAVLTKVSEEFAPHYLAQIRRDMRQTTHVPEDRGVRSQQPCFSPSAAWIQVLGGASAILNNLQQVLLAFFASTIQAVPPPLAPNNGLSGLFSWINAYRRQIFLLNFSTRDLYRSFSW
jgi:hypothetical protein